jgi:hypothetical protein
VLRHPEILRNLCGDQLDAPFLPAENLAVEVFAMRNQTVAALGLLVVGHFCDPQKTVVPVDTGVNHPNRKKGVVRVIQFTVRAKNGKGA